MMRSSIAAAVMLPLLLVAGCVGKGRITSVVSQAGLSPATSQCIAQRLIAQLSAPQLRKLARLRSPSRSVDNYITAVQRLNDPQITRVVIGSAALCAAGLG